MASNKVSIEIELLDRISGNLDRVNRKMDEMGRHSQTAKKELDALDGVSDKLKKSLAALGLAFSMKEVVGKIVNVRGEMQQLQVAFETMLGSAQKANALMEQLVNTAAITPFGLEDVANGAKQLLAYGFEAEKVNETLIRLGDIAAGLSVPLNDLVYLYGTTRAQGRLYTQDLNQFTGRGIPMIQELAKQFGVAEGKVKELVESGKVGFPEVQKVIEDLTDEGGKFGGLMEAQSKTITGQISNIQDAIDMMLNDIGQQQEGIINGVLGKVSYMIEHYEQFGRILLGVAATWGTYRTAVMVAAAATGWASAAEAIHYNWLLLVEKAQKLLNATMLSNPYVLVATAIAGVVAAMVLMKTEAERVKEADEAYEAQKQKVIEAEEEHRRRMEELIDVAGDESLSTNTRRDALVLLIQQYPEVFAKYRTECDMLKHIRDIKLEIAEIDGKKSVTKAKNELRGVNDRISELERKKATESYIISPTKGISIHTGGLSSSEEAELKSLRQRKGRLSEQVRKDDVNAYFANLTGVSNKDLQAQINERANLLAKMKTTGHTRGYTTNDSDRLRGTYTKDELEGQLQLLRAEQSKRNAPRKSSNTWGEVAKKAYQDALKEYNNFINSTGNKLTQEEYEKQAKALKDKVDTAKKEYDKTKPATDKDAEKASRAAAKAQAAEEKRRQAEEKRRQVKEKLGQELTALERENAAAEIEAMEDGTEKKLREIDNDYQRRKDEIEKQRADWKNENKKAGMVTGGDGLTDGQRTALDEAEAQAERTRQKQTADLTKDTLKAELEAMAEHLKSYGTLQEQKLAIAMEYAQKIKDIQDGGGSDTEKAWRIKTLEKERDASIATTEAKNLALDVDWGTTFEGVGNVLKDVAKETLDKVEAYMKTDEFRKLTPENKKTYADLQAKLKQETGGDSTSAFNFKIWDTIAQNVTAYQQSVRTLEQKTTAHTQAVDELEKAQKDLTEATDDTSRELAQKAVDIAKGKVETTAGEQNKAQEASDKARKTLTDNTNAAAQGIKNFKDYLNEMADGSLYGFANGITKLVTSLAKGSDGVGKSLNELGGKVGGIVGAILQIIDALGDDPKGYIDDLLEKVAKVVETIISELPEIITTIVEDVGKIVGGVISGVGSWFVGGSNEADMEAEIDELAASNERLASAIDDLKDAIADEDSTNSESIEAYRLAYKAQTEWNANQQNEIRDRAREYANSGYGFLGLGGKGSFDSYANDNRAAWLDAFNMTLKQHGYDGNLTGVGDVWNLSPEAMKVLKNFAPEAWSNFFSSGGHNSPEDLVDEYIDAAGALDDLTDSLNEKLTGYSWSGFKDSYVSLLTDLESETGDFADNINEILTNAVVNSFVNSKEIQDRIKTLYKMIADAASEDSDGGTDITEDEANAIRDYNESLANDMLSWRDAAKKAGLLSDTSSTSQSGKSGAFTTMTQDQGTKLEGMFTSGLQHWSSMDARMETVAERMATAESHLARIAENTGASAASVSELKEEFKKMVRDGLKVK